MNQPLIENVYKIAVLRANGLGDFIVTLPAIAALRAAYPHAEIVLLGGPWHADFLRGGRTPVDRVVVVPICRGIREEDGMVPQADELEGFFRSMRLERFDIAIHFQGRGIAANAFISQLGARITAGHTCPEAASADYAIPYHYYQNEVIRYLELVARIGAPVVTLESRISLLAADIAEAQGMCSLFELDRPYVVLHQGALDVRRQWPAEKFSALGDELARKGFAVPFTGNEADDDAIAEIIAGMRMQSDAHACNHLSLGGLAAILAGSVLVIYNDTGPLHLARAVGAKTVGIYWAPNLINWGPVTLRDHRPVISWTMQCPLCGTVPNSPYPFEPKMPSCDHCVSFVNDITVSEVMLQAEALLTAEPDRSAELINRHNISDYASTY